MPQHKFGSITMDMIVKLPTTDSIAASNFILLIIDRLSKDTRLVPCRVAMSGLELAQLVSSFWYTDFGVPDQTITDRGAHINNTLTAAVLHHLGIKQSLSSAYHPL
jgi:hypothetical protein